MKMARNLGLKTRYRPWKLTTLQREQTLVETKMMAISVFVVKVQLFFSFEYLEEGLGGDKFLYQVVLFARTVIFCFPSGGAIKFWNSTRGVLYFHFLKMRFSEIHPRKLTNYLI